MCVCTYACVRGVCLYESRVKVYLKRVLRASIAERKHGHGRGSVILGAGTHIDREHSQVAHRFCNRVTLAKVGDVASVPEKVENHHISHRC